MWFVTVCASLCHPEVSPGGPRFPNAPWQCSATLLSLTKEAITTFDVGMTGKPERLAELMLAAVLRPPRMSLSRLRLRNVASGSGDAISAILAASPQLVSVSLVNIPASEVQVRLPHLATLEISSGWPPYPYPVQ